MKLEGRRIGGVVYMKLFGYFKSMKKLAADGCGGFITHPNSQSN